MTPLPIKTAADRGGVNRRTLQRWIQRGHLRKLPDGKVDLDEVRGQIDYLLTARRRGPAPGQRRDLLSEEKRAQRETLADCNRVRAAIRIIDRIEDRLLVCEIADHAAAISNKALQKMGALSSAGQPPTKIQLSENLAG
jgi:hypothetical protein